MNDTGSENLTLVMVYLRRLTDDMGEVKQRVATIEHQIAHVVATEANHYASLSRRLDRVGDRLDRIERRLDQVEASPALSTDA